MNKVVMYTTRFCGFCLRAKALLESKGIRYQEVAVDGDRELRAEMMRLSGRRTVPQIWIGGQHIGGCSELMSLEMEGKLDQMLNADH